MKKKFFAWVLVAMAGLMVSCSEDEPNIQPPQQDPEEVVYYNYNPEHRTVQDAVKKAVAERESKLGIKTPLSRADELDVKCVVSNRKARSGEADTLYYAVNFPDSAGYAIIPVSGYLSTIAMTEQGSFEDVESIENKPLKMFFNAVEDYIEIKEKEAMTSSPSISFPTEFEYFELDTIGYKVIPTKVKVKWGQTGSLAKYCPNGIVGCVPLACAMMMSYYKAPTSIDLTFPDCNNEHLMLKWTGINAHVKEVTSGSTCGCGAIASMHDAAAKLCRELGYRMNATYNLGGTGATLDGALNTLKQTFPSAKYSHKVYNTETAITDLETGVLIMFGLEVNGNNHCWIVDGYRFEHIITKIYKITNPGAFNERKTFVRNGTVYYENYLHVNWGWHGMDNGLYETGVFDVLTSNRLLDDPQDGSTNADLRYPVSGLQYISAAYSNNFGDIVIIK